MCIGKIKRALTLWLTAWPLQFEFGAAQFADSQLYPATIGRDEFCDNGEPETVALDPFIAPRAPLHQPRPLSRVDARTIVRDAQPQAGPRTVRLHHATRHAHTASAVFECVIEQVAQQLQQIPLFAVKRQLVLQFDLRLYQSARMNLLQRIQHALQF